jgi:hypothetical protein
MLFLLVDVGDHDLRTPGLPMGSEADIELIDALIARPREGAGVVVKLVGGE